MDWSTPPQIPNLHTFPFAGEPERAYTNDSLWDKWKDPVSDLCALPAWNGSAQEKERRGIYASLVMAIVSAYWNGNKHGRSGRYPMNDVEDPLNFTPKSSDPPPLNGDYYGHNIAAIAVDDKGRVLDFDFNHNDLFNSSAEHAEARLVRRLYSLEQIADAWPAPSPRTPREKKRQDVAKALGNDAVTSSKNPSADGAATNAKTVSGAVTPQAGKPTYASLKNVTIYTSLESCAQCSGVMALAGVKEVVYLQTDPGTYWVGRILRNLTTGSLLAPLPISGADIGFAAFAALDDGYKTFARRFAPGGSTQAFWIDTKGVGDPSIAITSYLCTSDARRIFAGAGNLEAIGPKYGMWCHDPSGHDCPLDECPLSNQEVLDDSKQFLKYVVSSGRRGTPHNI